MFTWLRKTIRNVSVAKSAASGESQVAVDRWVADGRRNFADGDFAQAEELFRRAIQARPGNPNFLFQLGETIRLQDRSSEAIEWLQRAIAAQESMTAPHFSLGCALQSEERHEEAAAMYRQAIALDPTHSEAREHLGYALALLGDRSGALMAFDGALRIKPESANAHVNRGLVLLSIGDYGRGWEEFEWRWRRPELQTIRKMFPQLWWDGSDLSGKTILLFAEQGFGDAIQFVRYVPIISRAGARVIVDCHPPLKDLFRLTAGVAQVLEDDADIARHELCRPLMSVPRLLGTTLDSIPAEVPYLKPSAHHVEKWREKVLPSSGTLRVGLVWASNPSTGYAWHKSVSPDAFAVLGGIAGVSFYSLQTGLASGQSVHLPRSLHIVDLTEELRDFSDTAGLISNLDLVISVDTAVAHLAGALGKPVWTLLPRNADWRWGIEGERSPWYPTMRLFRQPAGGDWNGVVAQVAVALRAFANPTQREVSAEKVTLPRKTLEAEKDVANFGVPATKQRPNRF